MQILAQMTFIQDFQSGSEFILHYYFCSTCMQLKTNIFLKRTCITNRTSFFSLFVTPFQIFLYVHHSGMSCLRLEMFMSDLKASGIYLFIIELLL